MFTDVDLTKNEVRGFEYRDFPVILFFKKGKEYVMYQGELENGAIPTVYRRKPYVV